MGGGPGRPRRAKKKPPCWAAQSSAASAPLIPTRTWRGHTHPRGAAAFCGAVSVHDYPPSVGVPARVCSPPLRKWPRRDALPVRTPPVSLLGSRGARSPGTSGRCSPVVSRGGVYPQQWLAHHVGPRTSKNMPGRSTL
ncbi:hypothetical protein MRX96_027557 [Rhipicephalus microplus]